MNLTIGVVLLAGLALFLALACVALLYVMGRPAGTQEKETVLRERPVAKAVSGDAGRSVIEAPTVQPPSRPAVQPPSRPAGRALRLQATPDRGVQQCLFVVLDRPGEATNRGLAGLLQDAGAQYDPTLGVYQVPATRTGYQLTIASSSPPGTLPPLHEGGEQPVVGGVSILVKFINKRRVARNPEALIRFTQSVADLGGQILDADRRVVTPDAIERLRHGTL
ncbi:cell division protein ZipA C-terminal FtsZ-binding domain-containing protein [Halomonas sp. M4R5S39]|uniref:cell division protein ZipA C-terminal FtsZ-binding domain-containing protein n=1 Tax=Halomonas kalidii TaxID=3043293 RepID=UPI0024A9D495|nr:cell division protein ZipA C-terminal FtsZ-binding domain-containing protein [Halomonas kalidii]MDI5984100.1 cell division protein ZipA C-terminal FtsZ-binding domain-containing protein [Halomonas kalidii]